MNYNLIRLSVACVFVPLLMLSGNKLAEAAVFNPGPGPVHYNWGAGSPGNGVAADHFTATFDQSGDYSAGDYFIQTFADDGVKVDVDGKRVIDRWSSYNGKADRALWLGVKGGRHTVKTNYLENVAQAAIFSDIVPFDSWLAYYYPNETMAGMPTAAKVLPPNGSLKKLSENFGGGGPAAGIGADRFSAKYTSAKRMPAGEYILRAKADDGVRVYVDGKLVLDRWQNGAYREESIKINISDREEAKSGEKDIHWVEVEYYDAVALGNVEVFFEPFQEAIKNNWVGVIYPNKELKEQGSPIVMGGQNSAYPISQLSYNWGGGNGSPHPSVPGDNFSARFTKKVNLKAGSYLFKANGDDAIRVYLDDKLILNAWPNNGLQDQKEIINVSGGEHTIIVEYYEGVGVARLNFEYNLYSQFPVNTGKEVHYNWGFEGPVKGQAADYFSTTFDQSGDYSAGDYFIQALADDGVRVDVNGERIIDRWSDYNGKADRALWLGVKGGLNTVKTHYLENVAQAGIFSDIVPLDSWLAYYYPNENLSGMPAAAKVLSPNGSLKKLFEDFGGGGPAAGIGPDHFSARYTSAKRISAGDYYLRTKADDGVRVYVDGKLVIDRWQNGAYREESIKIKISDREEAKTGEKDIHWIEVEYFDAAALGKIEVFFDDGYTNYPLVTSKEVHYNWGFDGPVKGQAADYFTSAFDQSGDYSAGDYFIQAFADDGVRVDVDGKRVIDRWSSYNSKADRALWLGVKGGRHTVKTNYLENVAQAAIFSDIVPFDSWLAYYYPNETIAGMPTAAKVLPPNGSLKKLSENFGGGGPAAGIGADRFSAKYTSAKRIPAGEYILRAKADDGVRVYVDGKLVLDRWQNGAYREESIKINISDREEAKSGEKDIHWVEVEYYDAVALGNVEVFFEPFQEAIKNNWVGVIYPNKELKEQGSPIVMGGQNSAYPISQLSYNWGGGIGSPNPSVPGDNFSARFTKKVNLETGTYLFSSSADDGIRVYLNNQLIINEWPSKDIGEKVKDLFVNGGEYTITVEYYEAGGNASLLFDYQKLSSNKIFYQPTDQVQYNWGDGSPVGFPADGFEAVFDQSRNFKAGDYFIQSFADDGIKVVADGNALINRWGNFNGAIDQGLWLGVTEGKHTLRTHYFDDVSRAAVFSHVIPFDSWLGYYYSNESVSGMPSAAKIIEPSGENKNLYENHFDSSPADGVQKDHFSVRYSTAKRIQEGNYLIRTKADDGVRVYLDGKLVLDRWTTGALREDTARINIANRINVPENEKDVHWIVVEYFDSESVGQIEFSLEKQPAGPIYLTTPYSTSLQQVVDIQMTKGPQTDLHAKYLREDALVKNASGHWIVNGSGWNVRGGPGTTFPIVGSFNNGVRVNVIKTITSEGQLSWYQVSAWMNPVRGDVEYYVYPANFSKNSNEYFQFLKLSESAGLKESEVNAKILNGKGILQDKGSSFIEAGTKLGINEVYLISHALLETGNGSSQLATGVLVSKVDGKDVEPKVVYNMYGINAKDSCPLQCGSEYAYKMDWTTPEKAIVGGAGFIANDYINKGQDTLYKMRWNPASPGTHQYATDIGWSVKQVNRIKNLYDLLSDYTLVFDEPKYK